ncbi:NAD+ synthase [bacterium]|nr:NAD+ synthase [bacterium]
MNIGIAQFDPLVGAVEFNTQLLLESLGDCEESGGELIVTPELFLVGYPPDDLIFSPDLMGRVDAALDIIRRATETSSVGIVVGAPWRGPGRRFYNSAFLISDGVIHHRWDKQLLPFYDVFNDPRLFIPGDEAQVVVWRGRRVAALICEDSWADVYPNDYSVNPISQLIHQRPELVVIPTASPFEVDKTYRRHHVLTGVARRLQCPIVMVNQVGAQDGLVYAGSSVVYNSRGDLLWQAPEFGQGCFVASLNASEVSLTVPDRLSQLAQAIETMISGYLHKSGFKKIVIGLSGGIDSAVVASLAVRAIGASNVIGLMMPSDYTSDESKRDAKQLAEALGIHSVDYPISRIYQSYLAELHWAQTDHSLAMENIQSRIRGTIAMAVANESNALVVSTGNKSELSMGYCTLYGDLIGAFAPLADVYKTDVFALANWINGHGGGIPEYTISRSPSAELRPNQTDQESLPPYDLLDTILKMYIDDKRPLSDIIQTVGSPELVNSIIARFHHNEFKRRQAPFGIKVSRVAFGKGRIWPVLAQIQKVSR